MNLPLPPRPTFNRVTVSNYRSIGNNVSIDLGELTVLVGINGSGKSNVADVFRFVAQALDDGLETAIEVRHGFDAIRRDTGGNRDLRIRLELEQRQFLAARWEEGEREGWAGHYELILSGTRDRYRIKSESAIIVSAMGVTARFLTKDGVVLEAPEGLEHPAPDRSNLTFPKLGGDQRLAPLFEALRSCEVYSIFPDTLREPQKPSQGVHLTKQGDNWSSIVRRVVQDERGSELRAGLARVTGDIFDLRVKRAGGGYLVVEFGHSIDGSDKFRWFDSARESDGTLRVAGLLTAMLQTPPLTLMGIEEPELTVHPAVIPLLYDFVQQTMLTSQVLLTTHSPDLLDLLDIDSVRVVQRLAGATTVSPVAKSQRRLVREQLAGPGELMRSQGLQPDEDSSE